MYHRFSDVLKSINLTLKNLLPDRTPKDSTKPIFFNYYLKDDIIRKYKITSLKNEKKTDNILKKHP
jgi:hypothetical protein